MFLERWRREEEVHFLERNLRREIIQMKVSAGLELQALQHPNV
jgi:hypothetical protein